MLEIYIEVFGFLFLLNLLIGILFYYMFYNFKVILELETVNLLVYFISVLIVLFMPLNFFSLILLVLVNTAPLVFFAKKLKELI